MTAYYSENDPKAAAWLRELIVGGHIAAGDVDERSIADVKPDDLRGYAQCHFFAGIGGWSLALRLAGWPDNRPVWTGSCPCQPFSGAGKGMGFDDERHLWPTWFGLLRECAPPTVFGEQVASKAGLGWLDLVQADMEGARYAVAAGDICAAGVGAPHWRQRLWFVGERLADGDGAGLQGAKQRRAAGAEGQSGGHAAKRGVPGGVGYAAHAARERNAGAVFGTQSGEYGARLTEHGRESLGFEHAGAGVGRLVHTVRCGREPRAGDTGSEEVPRGQDRLDGDRPSGNGRSGPLDGFWGDVDWLHCTDGEWRPVEPGTFPLADGVSDRVGLLRGYGNAIVPQVAAQIISAYLEV